MRYFDITLNKDSNGSYLYPKGVLAYESGLGNKAVDHLYYEDKGEAHLLLVVPTDAVLDSQVVSEVVVSEITEAQAIAISAANETPVVNVTDQGTIQLVQIKLLQALVKSLGKSEALTPADELTTTELKAINPLDSSVKGFEQKKILADRIEALKTAEVAKGN